MRYGEATELLNKTGILQKLNTECLPIRYTDFFFYSLFPIPCSLFPKTQ
ncbi:MULTISPECIES: hypothetical protein [unclassified Moorena]|nr:MULTISPECIES: hypothetical protein [unclassified Moorena]NEP21711.1 hypothetical protein [Moorena sp. SIO3I6]NEQ61022.1 hypothetical protein [Moorena sp. SIO4A1]